MCWRQVLTCSTPLRVTRTQVLLRLCSRGFHTAHGTQLAYDYFYTKDRKEPVGDDASGDRRTPAPNTAVAALDQGIISRLLPFQISTDEAIQRYNIYQAEECRGMQAAGLLSSKPPTTVRTAYFPVWCFTATISAEYRGEIGFKEPGGTLIWKEFDGGDWRTLCRNEQLSFQDHHFLQVYASYNYEPSLGAAALLPDASVLQQARALHPTEAERLCGPAGRAAEPSLVLTVQQQGPAGAQEPLLVVSPPEIEAGLNTAGWLSGHGGDGSQSQQGPYESRQADGSTSKPAADSKQAASGNEQQQQQQYANMAGSGTEQVSQRGQFCLQGGGVVIHAPDMQQGIAWQLAYRGLMLHLTDKASKAAIAYSKAADTKDIHVSIQIQDLNAQLLYSPMYVAHYQHGTRHKQGTSSIIIPQMFYATISGLQKGGLIATSHVSPIKTQAATVGVVGGLSLAAGSPGWLGLAEPLLSVGPMEGFTLAVISAALAGMWAQGLPQARRNQLTANQIRAEREFYKQYDARETKTAAAMAAAEAAGQAPSSTDVGAQADEYMQWLWMDYDWRRWQYDEPWNWDPVKKRAEAQSIAERTVRRRRERQEYLERLLEERRKRELEMEQEMLRSQRGRRPPGSRRLGSVGHEFAEAGLRMRGRRDFLGYYKLMGIGEEDDVTIESIKAAFKAQAMQLHPDRVSAAGGSASAQQEAHVKFQRLQMAYDVLRDPEKRGAYDRGQLVQ